MLRVETVINEPEAFKVCKRVRRAEQPVTEWVPMRKGMAILMSNILLHGGVGRDLFSAVQTWVGHWPWGLAVSTILSCGRIGVINRTSMMTLITLGVTLRGAVVVRRDLLIRFACRWLWNTIRQDI